MSYCVKILLCHKHETLSKCLHTTCLNANWRHLRHRFLQMHMEDIWHWYHCDPKLWTHSPYPLHSQFWHIMSMVCPCRISPLVIKKYPHHIGFLLGLGNIWHLSMHRPKSWWCCHPICELVQLTSTWFFDIFCFVKKLGITKRTKKNARNPLPPFL
jgi:hypothetical protein